MNNYMQQRPELVEALKLYVDHGVLPGSFLTAVLQNDLREACARADVENQRNLFHVVSYCYNKLPGGSWGSRQNVNLWLAHIAESKNYDG